jgi:hypothetical protein
MTKGRWHRGFRRLTLEEKGRLAIEVDDLVNSGRHAVQTALALVAARYRMTPKSLRRIRGQWHKLYPPSGLAQERRRGGGVVISDDQGNSLSWRKGRHPELDAWIDLQVALNPQWGAEELAMAVAEAFAHQTLALPGFVSLKRHFIDPARAARAATEGKT